MKHPMIAFTLAFVSIGAFACGGTLPDGTVDKCLAYSEAPAPASANPLCPNGTIVKISGDQICLTSSGGIKITGTKLLPNPFVAVVNAKTTKP